jgi:hypothetical protein
MKKTRDQVNCGLKVDFINDKGLRVSSEIVEVLLPSRSASTSAAAMTRGFVRESQLGMKPVVQASHENSKPVENVSEKQGSLETLSIPLPKR